MVYHPAERKTCFAVWDGRAVPYEKRVKRDELRMFLPYHHENNLVRNRVVLFPSEVVEYGSEEELVEEIRQFIHGLSTGTSI